TAELITTAFFAYVGYVCGDSVRKYSHTELMQMQRQLVQETQEKEAMNDRFKSFLPVVETLAEAQSSEAQADPENIEQVKLPTKEKKAIGTEYTCFEDGCSNTFTARTVWHKRCDQCREKQSKQHRKQRAATS
ncbi:MAG: hypothetical protein Q9M28_10565, partial [Mariprofundaceae bacterium]|nr:hypothetical protein [Mariprofundaceae bacterium]